MEFTKEQFGRCLFNPLEKGFYQSQKLKGIGPEDMVKYLVFMYDPASPYRAEYPEMFQRRTAAEKDSGFSPTADHKKTVAATIEFLKVVNNRVWSNIIVIEAAIWEMREMMLTRVDVSLNGSDKTSMAATNMKRETTDSIIDMDEKLDKLYDKFYGHDPELKKDAAEVVTVDFSPQKMARMLKGE